jgi:hypothetical protein
MLEIKLSPKEKKRVERGIRNIRILSRQPALSDTNRFIKRQQLRVLLIILGAKKPDKLLQADALDVINDWKPFKIKRLRKLINGRRPRQ